MSTKKEPVQHQAKTGQAIAGGQSVTNCTEYSTSQNKNQAIIGGFAMKNAKIDEPTGLDPYESETVTSERSIFEYIAVAIIAIIVLPFCLLFDWFRK